MLPTVTRVLDEAKGLVEYVASNETLDSYHEIIRVAGWRGDMLKKNAPFVDTHDYSTIEKLLGGIEEWYLDSRTKTWNNVVRWAKDVKENRLAQLGWAMTVAGFGPKAVSVGFVPQKLASKWDSNQTCYAQQLAELGLTPEKNVRVIYLEQQQIELSACILGANPDALLLTAKAYKAGVLNDDAIDFLSKEYTTRETASATDDPADVAQAKQRAREVFLRRMFGLIKQQ